MNTIIWPTRPLNWPPIPPITFDEAFWRAFRRSFVRARIREYYEPIRSGYGAWCESKLGVES